MTRATIRDLRERLKGSYGALREVARQIGCRDANNRYMTLLERDFRGSMERNWIQARDNDYGRWIARNSPMDLAIRAFVRDGHVYYHARRHGMASAVLFKLSLP